MPISAKAIEEQAKRLEVVRDKIVERMQRESPGAEGVGHGRCGSSGRPVHEFERETPEREEQDGARERPTHPRHPPAAAC